MEKDIYSYDVALSFAGEDRSYVEETAVLLKEFGVRVFYDKFEETNLWGKNLFEYLNDVYKNKAKYTVMFISEHYREKLWTNHERKSMQERAFLESSEYILPVRFDDTEIPGLHSTIAYINLKDKFPGDLARLICQKIGWATKNRWCGSWEIETVSMSYSSMLKIKKVYADHFEFSFSTLNGAHLGQVEGNAVFTAIDQAVFRSSTDDNRECIMNFLKTNDVIQVEENLDCLFYHGVRAYFQGIYKLRKDIFYLFDFVNDSVLTILYSFLQDDLWDEFLKCFGDVHYNENNNSDMHIIEGGVPGLYHIYEALLIVDRSCIVSAAFLDDDKVYYFSSAPDLSLHALQINEWCARFENRERVNLTTEIRKSSID